jgi:hypothetical protein
VDSTVSLHPDECGSNDITVSHIALSYVSSSPRYENPNALDVALLLQPGTARHVNDAAMSATTASVPPSSSSTGIEAQPSSLLHKKTSSCFNDRLHEHGQGQQETESMKECCVGDDEIHSQVLFTHFALMRQSNLSRFIVALLHRQHRIALYLSGCQLHDCRKFCARARIGTSGLP